MGNRIKKKKSLLERNLPIVKPGRTRYKDLMDNRKNVKKETVLLSGTQHTWLKGNKSTCVRIVEEGNGHSIECSTQKATSLQVEELCAVKAMLWGRDWIGKRGEGKRGKRDVSNASCKSLNSR